MICNIPFILAQFASLPRKWPPKVHTTGSIPGFMDPTSDTKFVMGKGGCRHIFLQGSTRRHDPRPELSE